MRHFFFFKYHFFSLRRTSVFFVVVVDLAEILDALFTPDLRVIF